MIKENKKKKVGALQKLLQSSGDKTEELKKMALSPGGLCNDDIRRVAWPIMAGVNTLASTKKPSKEVLKDHKDYGQVVMDVRRSYSRFPKAMKEEQRLVLQSQLTDLIMRVLVADDNLHYYQGFHDICVTFLLVLGENLSYPVILSLTSSHLGNFLDANLKKTRHMLNYLYPIFQQSDKELYDFMQRSEAGNVFCLSWFITWFGHVLADFKMTVRLYDFFLATDPLMPIYVSAAIVFSRKKEVMESECEICTIHSLLSRPPDNLPLEDILASAMELYDTHPPTSLESAASAITAKTVPGYDLDSTMASRTYQYTAWAISAAVGAALVVMNYLSLDGDYFHM